MTLWDSPSGGALSDSELDAVLARADADLLDHVRARTHPDQALLAMMATNDGNIPVSAAAEATVCSATVACVPSDHAVTVIAMRLRTRDIDCGLNQLLLQTDSMSGFVAAVAQLHVALVEADAIGNTARGRHHPPGRWRGLRWLALIVGACRASLRLAKLAHLLKTPVVRLSAAADRIPRYEFDRETSELRSWVLELAGSAECDACGNSEIRSLCAALVQVVDDLSRDLPALDQSLTRVRSLLHAVLPKYAEKTRKPRLKIGLWRRREIALSISGLATQAIAAVETIEGADENLARAKSLNPVKPLAAVEIDASGADLSTTDVSDLQMLEGVIWTDATTWPPGTTEVIRAHSDAIGEGVYQVRRGNEHRPSLVTGRHG